MDIRLQKLFSEWCQGKITIFEDDIINQNVKDEFEIKTVKYDDFENKFDFMGVFCFRYFIFAEVPRGSFYLTKRVNPFFFSLPVNAKIVDDYCIHIMEFFRNEILKYYFESTLITIGNIIIYERC